MYTTTMTGTTGGRQDLFHTVMLPGALLLTTGAVSGRSEFVFFTEIGP